VKISFSRHSPNWQVVKEFSLAKSENNWPSLKKLSVRGKEILVRLANTFVFLLAKPEFYIAFGELASGYPNPYTWAVGKQKMPIQ
jgi:hypothetical protein